MLDFLSKHPIDWSIHFALCFLAIAFNWATWFVVIFVSILIEYEQWNYSGRPELKYYFIPYVLGDLIFDFIGIIGGIYAN